MVKKLKIPLFISTESTNVTDRRTDTALRHRPRLHIIARQKLNKVLKVTATLFDQEVGSDNKTLKQYKPRFVDIEGAPKVRPIFYYSHL